MKAQKIFTFFLAGFFIILSSCEEVGDYYIGMNQQPEIIVNTFEEGLNIFGLLRPDQKQDFNKSFIFVQQNWPSLEMDNHNIIHNTNVILYRLENGLIADSLIFPLMPSDSLFSDTLYRPSEEFQPEAGQHYKLVCDHPDFPVAMGETIIPSQPEVDKNSININGSTLEFSVFSDTSIKMMDVYLVSESDSKQVGRYVPADNEHTLIRIDLPNNSSSRVIKIFSYDNKLATYYANSNTSLNFNKYRTTFSTLESGFGVFGSMNLAEVVIDGK